MAMPKKGSRKIVVDGKEYRYFVRSRPGEDYGGMLTVEFDGHFTQKTFESYVTPVMVEKFIRNKLTLQ
jgi:hypothetical protein